MATRKQPIKPKQARAMASVEAIVEAAARILVDEGYAALTTNQIAKVAGVSVGTLYQYFEDKEAVVHLLVDQQVERMQTAFSEALTRLVVGAPPDSLEEAVGGVLDATLEAMRVRPALFSRLIREAPRDRREDLDRRWRQRYTELLSAALRTRHGELRQGDVTLMAHVLVTGVYAVIVDAAAYRPELMATDALRQELVHLVIAYLRP